MNKYFILVLCAALLFMACNREDIIPNIPEPPIPNQVDTLIAMTDKYELPAEGGDIDIEIKSNVTISYSIDNKGGKWISYVETKLLKTSHLVFKVAANDSTGSRQATIAITGTGGTPVQKVTITQEGAKDKSWINKTFYHRSLAIRFTADWCGYCPMMERAFTDAQKDIPQGFEVLNAHTSGNLVSETSVALASHYSITSLPTGLVDCRVQVPNYTLSIFTTMAVVKAINETEERYGTVTGMSWTSSITGNKAEIKLRTYLKKAGTYKLTVLLVENNIAGYQAEETGPYLHNGVIRTSFTDISGDEFIIEEDDSMRDFSYTANIQSSSEKKNLRIVAYIQREDDSGKYYVDNTSSAELGKKMPLMVKSENIDGGVEGFIPGDDILM